MQNAHSILILLLISYWQHMEIQYTYVLFIYAKIFAVTYILCYVFCRKFVHCILKNIYENRGIHYNLCSNHSYKNILLSLLLVLILLESVSDF